MREHFHDPGDFAPMVEDREGPESCNTYNMLRLTRALAERGLRPEHLDWAERALFNHVLSAQHPERGGFVYFTSLRPQHYRVYSTVDQCFWCCVGTGIESQARYGEWVFGVEDGALAINLFVPATLEAPSSGAWCASRRSSRKTRRSRSSSTSTLPLFLRAAAGPGVGGRTRRPRRRRRAGLGGGGARRDRHRAGCGSREPGSRSGCRSSCAPSVCPTARSGRRSWRVRSCSPRATRMTGSSGCTATTSAGVTSPGARSCRSPMCPIVTDAEAAELLTETSPLHYRLRTADPADDIGLEPFAGIHDARYTVYWPVAATASAEARRTQLRERDLDALGTTPTNRPRTPTDTHAAPRGRRGHHDHHRRGPEPPASTAASTGSSPSISAAASTRGCGSGPIPTSRTRTASAAMPSRRSAPSRCPSCGGRADASPTNTTGSRASDPSGSRWSTRTGAGSSSPTRSARTSTSSC